MEVYEAADGWRWHLKDDNSEIVAQGEAYTRKADAIDGAHNACPMDDIWSGDELHPATAPE